VSSRRWRRRSAERDGESGQAIYEFAILVPVFLLIVVATLEFGFLFLHNLTLEYASREGARAGAAMADGSVKDSQCQLGAKGTIGDQQVDPLIIAAVQRVLESPGSQLRLSNGTGGITATTVTIYHADANGNQIGAGNTWTYTGTNTVQIPCQLPVGYLHFTPGPVNWPAASRKNAPLPPGVPDSIGVAINYAYVWQTPLGGILRLINGVTSTPQFAMSDKTVMALEPTKQQ